MRPLPLLPPLPPLKMPAPQSKSQSFGRAMPADSVARFTARFGSGGREILRLLLLALLAEFTLLPLRDIWSRGTSPSWEL